MKSETRAGVAAIATFVLLTFLAPAQAGGPQPLGNWWSNGNIQNPVEQQSPDWNYPNNAYNIWQCTHDGTLEDWANGTGTEHPDNCIHNPWTYPDHCTWDADDHWGYSSFGYLNAGTTISKVMCDVAEERDNFGGAANTADVQVTAGGKTLTVTMTDNRGHSWTAEPIADGNQWKWVICHIEDDQGPFAEIPDSNGGVGLRLDYTVTITASKKTNSIAAYLSTWGWLREFGSITNCPNIYEPGNPGF